MNKFIYVFTLEDRMKMIEAGYSLLTEQPEQSLYIFKADPQLKFADGVKAIFSSILSF